MKIFQLLKQPFPYNPSWRPALGRAAFFGLFIFMFLFVFRPFELDKFNVAKLVFICGAYGFITFACLLSSNLIIPGLFPAWFSERRWTTGRHILYIAFIVIFVGLVNYLFSPLIVGSKLNLRDALWFQGITILVALIPISFYTLYMQTRLLKKYSEQAADLEKKLMTKQETEKKTEIVVENNLPKPIILTGDYQHEKIELYPDQLHLVSSASNYIKVYHDHKGVLNYSIIRSTLKKTEEMLSEHSNFFKCHRAYIINLDKVVHVEGNAQGYRIKVSGHDDLIPVSRNLNNEFSDKLLAYRKLID